MLLRSVKFVGNSGFVSPLKAFENTTRVLSSMKTFKFKYTTKIVHPNSLVFNHKKDMDRLHKQVTRMKKPKHVNSTIDHKKLIEEFDVDPGLSFLLRNSKFDFYSSVPPFDVNTKQEISSPLNAWIRLVIPFHENEELRRMYKLLNTNNLRVSRLMELLDYFTGRVAYKYCNFLPSKNEVTLVTASVDRIELFSEMTLDKPLVITSYPSYIGESSLEIRVDLSHDPNDSDEGFIGSAFFNFAARNPNNYKEKYLLPKSDFTIFREEEGEVELNKALLRQEIGLSNKNERISDSKFSLFKTPPTQEESEILHNLYLKYRSSKEGDVNYENHKPIIETLVDKTILMHSQDKNVHGKIFGGYIMRQALELAWICAKVHNKYRDFKNICIDNVIFHKPVKIGSIATYKAVVVYVYKEMMSVSVEVFNDVDGETTLTTTINVIYLSQTLCPSVVPTTYDCGLKYLEAKRRTEKIYSHY